MLETFSIDGIMIAVMYKFPQNIKENNLREIPINNKEIMEVINNCPYNLSYGNKEITPIKTLITFYIIMFIAFCKFIYSAVIP